VLLQNDFKRKKKCKSNNNKKVELLNESVRVRFYKYYISFYARVIHIKVNASAQCCADTAICDVAAFLTT